MINNKNNKSVCFKHFTGIVESSISITKFCEKHPELGENAKYHFSGVLSGSRLHYKGWMIFSKKNIDLTKVRFINQILLKRAI